MSGATMAFRTAGFNQQRRLAQRAATSRDDHSPPHHYHDPLHMTGATKEERVAPAGRAFPTPPPFSPPTGLSGPVSAPTIVEDAPACGHQPTGSTDGWGGSPTSTTAATPLPLRNLTAEDDEGDVEYKWRLTGISTSRFEHLVTQMQFRVSEGHGQCLYELGVSDDGVPKGLPQRDFEESVDTIRRMAATLGFDMTIVQQCVVSEQPERLLCGELLVSRRHAGSHDVSLAFCGAVGSGKSTLMGVLLTASLDDGSGSTRQSLFNHKHEVDSGRTSSIASRVWAVQCNKHAVEDSLLFQRSESSREGGMPPMQLPDPASAENGDTASDDRHSPTTTTTTTGSPTLLLNSNSRMVSKDSLTGLEGSGQGLPHPYTPSPNATRRDCTHDLLSTPKLPSAVTPAFGPQPLYGLQPQHEQSQQKRFITLLDVGGDITKTMLFGLMSRKPDYVCICLAADHAASALSLYAQVCCAMGTPFMVCVTKCDLVEEFELDGYLLEVAAVLNTVGCASEVVEDIPKALEYCRNWLPMQRDGAVDGTVGNAAYHPASIRVPVYCVSSVTGDGLERLQSGITHLRPPPASPPMTPLSSASKRPFEVLLERVYIVKGVGPVVRGTVSRGAVEVGCNCYVGPDVDGAFFPVVVRGVHVDGVHVNEAQAGDDATFALDRLPPSVDLSRKGKVLVRQPEKVCQVFVLTVRPLSQTLTDHLEPILYTRNARQAVQILSQRVVGGGSPVTPLLSSFSPNCDATETDGTSDANNASSNEERALEVVCRFMFRPEVLLEGAAAVLHWTPNGIAVGCVSEVRPLSPVRSPALRLEVPRV